MKFWSKNFFLCTITCQIVPEFFDENCKRYSIKKGRFADLGNMLQWQLKG